MIIIGAIFLIYLVTMVVIGIKFYDKSSDLPQYILGGRKIHPFVAAMSAQATDMSGWLLMGLPGLAFATYIGTAEAIWTIIGLWIGTYLNWLCLAKRLRSYTEKVGALTFPDYFEKRFKDTKHVIKTISAIIIVIIFLVYMASQFCAAGKLFSTLFGMNYMVGVIVGAVIILVYTAIGGFTAVCWTDTVQGVIMFIALIVVPIVGVAQLGNWDAVMAGIAQTTTEEFSFLPMADGKVNILLLSSALGWAFGYFGHPGIHARFMAINSPEEIKYSRRAAMIWISVTMAAAVIVGMVGRALFPTIADPENIFIHMITELCNPVIGGVLLISVLAAIMSTASSQLLVSASSISVDIYATLFKKTDDDKKLVWVSRLTVVIISIVAIFIASNPNGSIFGLVSCAWSGFGAAFGPVIILSLFWKKVTRQGALWGMVVGGVVDVFWYLSSGGIFDIYEIIPGFFIGLAVTVIVSLMTKVDAEIEKEFDEVVEQCTGKKKA